MLIQFVLLVAGLVLLVKGADWLINGASALARKFNVSNLAIGLTVVAFGTSAPELVVNSIAAYQDYPDLVFGNVIGSNILNLFVILGIVGLISPLQVQSSTVWKEIPYSFLAIVFLFVLGNDHWLGDNTVSRWDGAILGAMFLLFLYYVYRQQKVEELEADVPDKTYSTLMMWLLIVIGLAGLVLGGELAVSNAVKIAQAFGVSEKVIGLTIIAAGTSLPELATSVVAALKKKNDIAVGNIVGSNIFNIFFIMATSALVRPMHFDRGFNTELYVLAGGTLFLFIAMFTGKKGRLDRGEAFILLAAYAFYSVYLMDTKA